MYARPSPFRGLGAVAPPVATVGGKIVCEGGATFVIADDTGKRWRLTKRGGRALDAELASCTIARVKARGYMVGPDTIELQGWGRLAAGEQTLTTIVGGEAHDAPPAPTDTVEANLRAIDAGTGPLFVGDNTRSLVEQASGWTDEQGKTFAELRDPAAQAFRAYLESAQAAAKEADPEAEALSEEEIRELVAEAVPDRAAWNPEIRSSYDDMWGHIPKNADLIPDALQDDAQPSAVAPTWLPWAAAAAGLYLLTRGKRRGRR